LKPSKKKQLKPISLQTSPRVKDLALACGILESFDGTMEVNCYFWRSTLSFYFGLKTKLSFVCLALSHVACMTQQPFNSPTGETSLDSSEKMTTASRPRKGLLGLSDRMDGLQSRPTGRGYDERNNTRTPPALLTQVSGNVWRSSVSASRVFSVVSRLLAQSYVLSRIDNKNLSVQTDWDKFFIDGRLFRNRVHVSVFAIGARQTEVVVRNNLEYFSGTNDKSTDSTGDGQWLPSPDITNEVATLIKGTRLQLQSTARRAD
jgi:hypothetical protein